MADLVFGLAKSAVTETVNIAKIAIEEETKLKKSVQRDLMLISDEFEMMHSFLNVAKDEHASDEMAKTCVRQVRNMALDVEDCIETVVHLDNKSSWWRRVLPSCIPMHAPAAALDDAFDSIALLKARVEALGQRNMRYSRICDSGTKLTQPLQLPAEDDTAKLGILVQAREAAKEYPGRPNIFELIKDDSTELKVISVWRAGDDLGTKSFIRDTYHHPWCSERFVLIAWAKLMHPFNPHEFIKILLSQFSTNYRIQEAGHVDLMEPAKVMLATEEVLVEKFFDLVRNHRYLVFLEGVSSMVDWESARMYLPENYKGSCIMVHTQQFEIASLCVGNQQKVILEMERFSSGRSVCAIYKKAEIKCPDEAKMKARLWLSNFNCIGRTSDLWNLKVMMTWRSYVSMVPVWGIAGVGMSSLVRKVYYTELCSDDTSFNMFGWVDVTHPFSIWDLSWKLILDMDRNSYGPWLTIKDPVQECRTRLHERKCIIVIDGLQRTEEWDLVEAAWAFGHSSSRSRIVVITNEEIVATHCATQRNMEWNIRGLESEDALDLFKQRLVSNTVSLTNTVIDEELTPILRKCGGLPKVIVAIADTLATEFKISKEGFSDVLKKLGDNFMHELETNREYSILRGVFAWVQSYFQTCPDIIKPCIFYTSIFPVNHHIRRRRLVRRWIAEGYSRDTKDSTGEETAEEFFSKLVKLNMIQVVQSTVRMFFDQIRVPLCQVNGFFHEYIKSRSMEENLVFSLEGRCSLNSQRTGRHLSIDRSWDRDTSVYESIDNSRLRSLTVFGKWESFFISKKMSLLRVLDLEDTSGVTDGDLEQMVNLLPRLKFLSLRGCKEVTRLPKSIGDLRQLQTLDIRHTSITTLPMTIIKLRKLQYIRAGTKERDDNCTVESQSLSTPRIRRRCAIQVSCLPGFCKHRRLAGGVEVPGGIGELSALHTLSIIDVSGPRGHAILEELKKLSQLHNLGVSGINRKNSKDLLSIVSGHGHLESLSLRLEPDNQSSVDGTNQFHPPEKLQNIKLYGLERNLPGWIKMLGNLRKLNLQMDMVFQDVLSDLQNMPTLQILILNGKNFHGAKLDFQDGFFELIVLEIFCNSNLDTLIINPRAFSRLEVLKIRCCGVSSLEIRGLQNRDELKEVQLSGSYSDDLKKHLQEELEKNLEEVKPVLKVEGRSL